MRYLLDTNVVSEPRKPEPSRQVMTWLATTPADDKLISVLTAGELRKGATQLRARGRAATAAKFDEWMDSTLTAFADRVIGIDQSIAERWGRLQSGDPLPAVDSLIAATALVHGWTVATRNIRHFERCGVPVVNPFTTRP